MEDLMKDVDFVFPIDDDTDKHRINCTLRGVEAGDILTRVLYVNRQNHISPSYYSYRAEVNDIGIQSYMKNLRMNSQISVAGFFDRYRHDTMNSIFNVVVKNPDKLDELYLNWVKCVIDDVSNPIVSVSKIFR